jgi:2-polyprenyl-3-methyl-5-hydroxy-6-metoxy-1,4-benzoquinol methylase
VSADDEHFGHDSEEARTAICDILATVEGDSPRLVDVGCGVGHLLEAVAEDRRLGHWGLAGFDLSKHMVEVANKKLEHRAVVSVGSADDWQAEGGADSVDVVTSTFNVVNHFPTEAIVEGMFRCAYQALKPSGFLLFDVLSKTGHRRMAVNDLQERDDGGLYLSSGARVSDTTVALRELVFMAVGDGTYRRVDSHVLSHFYEPK